MNIFLYLLILFIACEARVFPDPIERDISSFIETSMKCHHIPGMTLAVVKGDDVWTKGFGKEDFSTGKMVDGDSKFGIGSITKAFTATLLGILMTEKGLDWKTKVISILGPEYQFIDEYRTKELSLRDLLSHRTGLARLDFGLETGFPRNMSAATFCKNLKYLPEEIPIRDGFIYNNYMFMMLGHVTEILGGDTWENLVTAKVLQPIGMNKTTFIMVPEDTQGPHIARPYIYKDEEFQNGTKIIYDMGPIGSAGAIASSSTDMAKWIRFNLKLGQTESGEQLIDKKLLEDMRQPTTPMAGDSIYKPEFPVDYVTSAYGYGWFLADYRGYRVVQHTGGLFSYISGLMILPDMNSGVFISVNGPGYGNYAGIHDSVSAMYVADHLLGLQPWLNTTTACTYPQPWRKENKTEHDYIEVPAINNLTDYQGSYGNHLFADVEVSVNSSQLCLKSDHIHGILHSFSEKDKFFFEVTYPWEFTAHDNTTKPINITFQRDGVTGIVRALTAKLEVDLTYVKGESIFDETTTSGPSHTIGGMKSFKNGSSSLKTSLVSLLICLLLRI